VGEETWVTGKLVSAVERKAPSGKAALALAYRLPGTEPAAISTRHFMEK